MPFATPSATRDHVARRPDRGTPLPPTETPTPTTIPSPTATPSPTPTASPTPTSSPTPLPADYWNDVPIMIEARSKRDLNGTFAYTVPASLAEVQAYYAREMSDLGWRATSELVTDDGAFTMFVFEKDKVNVGVSVSALGPNLSYVTLGLY